MSIKTLLTPGEIQQQLSELFKQARLENGDSRTKAENRTGVPAATIRRFESTGEISLRQFILLCHVYGNIEKLKTVFPEPVPESIDALLSTPSIPKRGRS